jgi:[amino group carrier protein]-6-phospho-L-2-aminoadipate/5-phospho-L-glutamate reductase
LKVSVIGASGYAGGELLRLLLNHPSCEIESVTSQRYSGEPVYRVHPNLRGTTALKFDKNSSANMRDSEVVFTALPHGKSSDVVSALLEKGKRIVDLSADFRLKNPSDYETYYGYRHNHLSVLEKSVYGLPELHRQEIRKADLVSVPGCMATASILGLAPIVREQLVDPFKIVVDSKIGSSGAGVSPTLASHHSERSEGVRPYKATNHRHIAEIEQELSALSKGRIKISFTPHAVDMVRGVLATIHAFSDKRIEKKDVWKAYRSSYSDEPFVRMVSDNRGLYGLPNPKASQGTNYCDIGFELDSHSDRLVVFSALDNLTKGAAGQAVQCFNIMTGTDERAGLSTLALHP